MMKHICVILIFFFGIGGCSESNQQTVALARKGEVQVEKIAKGLGVVWGVAFLGDDEIIFTERQGSIQILDLNSKALVKLSGNPPVRAAGQGGMLDVAVPQDYRPGDWIYFTYVKDQGGKGVTTLARAQRSGKQLVKWSDLLVTQSATTTSRHFGSRITFDGKGHLYFSVGDRGYRPNGQDNSTHAGTVIRLNLDGSIPADNPYVSEPNSLSEIWSYGHRNIQGIVYDRENDRLWAIEHGPRGGDEINVILPGRNYGWPMVSYGKEYSRPVPVGKGTKMAGVEDAVKVYIPSIAPGSLIYYNGAAFPDWQGNLLAGALKLRHINRVELNSEGVAVAEERLLEDLGERIRALAVSPEGWLYFSTDSGMIQRIIPAD